jgi:hypothetical protein
MELAASVYRFRHCRAILFFPGIKLSVCHPHLDRAPFRGTSERIADRSGPEIPEGHMLFTLFSPVADPVILCIFHGDTPFSNFIHAYSIAQSEILKTGFI